MTSLNPELLVESIINSVLQVDVLRKTTRSAPSPSGRGLG